MLFFRSEKHLQNWHQYNPDNKDGISTLNGMLAMFSTNLFKKRMDPHYFSNFKTYIGELIQTMGSIKGIGNYMKS